MEEATAPVVEADEGRAAEREAVAVPLAVAGVAENSAEVAQGKLHLLEAVPPARGTCP